jgi:hypothetical protein
MTLDNFDEMLSWLDADRPKAVEKYQKIRGRIIKIYNNRGCHYADEVADRTDLVVCRKIKETVAKWGEGDDPALHFYAVAKRIYQELIRPAPPRPLPPASDSSADKERCHACLEQCLGKLKQQQRDLILRFHEGEKQIRIENRKRLAGGLKINTKALSLRAFRIHRELRDCVEECLKAAQENEVDSEFFH